MDSRHFNPDDKIAPGLYMDYWRSIAERYNDTQLNSNRLKPYREVRNGAILAALWTKTTGNKHFVSFPHDEPADVEIYSLGTTELNGIPSYNLQKVPVQLTRCSLADGETVVEQIRRKNSLTLANTTLVVHLLGEDDITINLNEIVTSVREIGTLYPKEIVLLAPLEDASTIEQTFGQILLHSREDAGVRTSRVNLGDEQAFFRTPSVMVSQRGTGMALEPAGEINLLLP